VGAPDTDEKDERAARPKEKCLRGIAPGNPGQDRQAGHDQGETDEGHQPQEDHVNEDVVA